MDPAVLAMQPLPLQTKVKREPNLISVDGQVGNFKLQLIGGSIINVLLSAF